MKSVTKNISGYMAIVGIIVLYFVYTLVYKLLPDGDMHDWVYYLVCGGVLIAVTLILPKLLGYPVKNEIGLNHKPDITTTLIVICVGVLLMVFGLGYSNIAFYLLQAIGYSNIATIPVMNNALTIILGFVGLGLLPSLGEEFLVRGSVLNSLKSTVGAKKAIILSALFFGLMHGSVSQLGHQFLVGIACAIVVLVGKSIWYGVILHFVNNAITLTLSVVSFSVTVTGATTPSEFFGSLDFAICIGLMVVGLVGVFLLLKYLITKKVGRVHAKGLNALESLGSVSNDWVDRGQNRIFYASLIALGVLVVVDFVVVMCGVGL